MAPKPKPPTTPTGQQASVAAIEAAASAAGAPHTEHDTGPREDGGIPATQAPTGFDWSALAAPKAMPTKPAFTGIKTNVLETVPEPIRQRAEQSLAINAALVAKHANSTSKRNRVAYHWDVQPVSDAAMGEAFSKLLAKYAKFRPADKEVPHAGTDSPKGQVTARSGDTRHFRDTEDSGTVACDAADDGAYLGVRYSVRPFEARADSARVPGTA